MSTEELMLSKLNLDDLIFDESSPTSRIKVVIAYPSGNVTVKSNFDDESKCIIMNICLSHWQTVVNAVFRHHELSPELLKALQQETRKEFAYYSKFDSCLKFNSPDQLATFSNRTLWHEVLLQCPIYAAVVNGACDMEQLEHLTNTAKETAINAVALATSALARIKNPQMSAVAYRISTILSHSGVSYRDIT